MITPDVLLPLWEAHRAALDHPSAPSRSPDGSSTTGRTSSA